MNAATAGSLKPVRLSRVVRSVLLGLLMSLAALCGATRPADASDGAIAGDGAIGVNAAWEAGTSPLWYIELQRQGADFVRDGTQHKDPAVIQTGLTILDWGFAHEASDGSFPGTANGTTGQMFHSTAIFVEAAARATNQLKAYDAVTYADVVSRYTVHLQATCDWFLQADVAAAGQVYNARFTHRRYMLAAGLAQVAELVSDGAEVDKLNAAAVAYARDGISLMLPAGSRAVITHRKDWSAPPAYLLTPEQPNPPQKGGQYAKGTHVISAWGINPENNGYDVSYQGVGIMYAEHYYPLCPDPDLKVQIAAMIDRACRWESSRIDRNGLILTIGTSRIGIEKNRNGAIKGVNPFSIKSDFLTAYKITGNTQLLDAAHRLNTGN